MFDRIDLLHVASVVAAALLLSVSSGACAQEPMDCISDDDVVDNVEYLFLVPGLFLTGTNVFLVAHNASRLDSGNPSGRGGIAGVLFGTLGTTCGALVAVYSEEDVVKATGIGCAVAGVISIYYGGRSIQASNRRYDEEHQQTMVIDPILIGDGTGRLGPGLQVSWKF